MTFQDVRELLSDLLLRRGCPTYIRPGNGPGFIARSLRSWYGQLAGSPLFIQPGSPWENADLESFNGKLRDEPLNGELFFTLHEAQIITE